MSLWKIAWRSIQQRALASSLTALSMALGVALVVTVLVMHGVVQRAFQKATEGYDLVVGAKGGRLDLVLNSVYHLGRPVGNIPWDYYKQFRKGGRFASQVSAAVPLCLGDNYEGYRVVGTLPELFELGYSQTEQYRFAQGRNFESDHFFEAVVGAQVARKTGLAVGSTFQPTHGISNDGDGHKHDAFTVVGVLAPTGTPNDRAVFVNMEGFFLLDNHTKPLPAGHVHDHDEKHAHDEKHEHEKHEHERPAPAAATPHAHSHDHPDEHHHDHAHHEPLPEAQREVTAILVRTTLLGSISLPDTVNKDSVAQAVHPVREIRNLFDGVVGNVKTILLGLAILIVVVAGIGVLVSIYNSMSERRREIAIMRSLGAARPTVMAIVLLESILLSVGGGVAGIVLGHVLLGVMQPWILAQTGVQMTVFEGVWRELVIVPSLVVLASLAGFLPALNAYRTDVSRTLSASP